MNVRRKISALVKTYIEQLQAEGASEYEATLAGEAAQMAWMGGMMRIAARTAEIQASDYLFIEEHLESDGSILEEASQVCEELARAATTGKLYELAVQDLAQRFGRTGLEVSMYLGQLVQALLRECPRSAE